MKRLLQDRVLWSALVLLALCVLLGGANREHALRLSLLELASLPVLAMAGLRLHDMGGFVRHRFLLTMAASVALIPLIQLVPLPPQLWTALPGREQAVLALEVAGLEPGWSTISLTPDHTWRSFLALLPPMALLTAALCLDRQALRTSLWVLIGMSALSILLGAAQGASGSDALYPWSTTTRGSISGFFANRNHLATLCLVTLPFAAVLSLRGWRRGEDGRAAVWAGGLFVVLGIVALGAIRSRAGVLLAGPVLGLTALTVWIAWGRLRPGPGLIAMIAAVVVAVSLVVGLGLNSILARFDDDREEGRFQRWATVATAAQTYLPVGAGLGSFDPVYRSVEPLEELDETYFNRAHNEYLETWLETGWLGVAVLIAFLVWLTRRAWAAWRTGKGSEIELARAATVALLAILAHSAGDYPLRTVTLTATLALLCAVLERGVISPPEGSRRRNTE